MLMHFDFNIWYFSYFYFFLYLLHAIPAGHKAVTYCTVILSHKTHGESRATSGTHSISSIGLITLLKNSINFKDSTQVSVHISHLKVQSCFFVDKYNLRTVRVSEFGLNWILPLVSKSYGILGMFYTKA